MPKWERQIWDWLGRARFWVAMGVLLALSVLMRYSLREHLSADMAEFLLPWMDAIAQHGGFPSLGEEIGNYSVAYMLLLVLGYHLPLQPMAAVKLFSVLADYGMAFAVGLTVYRLRAGQPGAQRRGIVAGVLTTLLPLPVLNSAAWGQCDAVYTVFLLLAVCAAVKKRWPMAYVWFGIAVCFKLQAVFLLPFFVLAYIAVRGFSALYFLLLPAILFVSSLPAVILRGQPLIALDIYFGQADEYQNNFMNYPNLSVLFKALSYEDFSRYLIWLALAALACMFFYIWVKDVSFSGDGMVLAAAWSVLACAMFLPSFHERYAFAAEMLLWLWFILRPSWKRGLPLLAVQGVGLASYATVLSGVFVVDDRHLMYVNVLAFVYLTWRLVNSLHPREALQNAEA